MPELPEVETIRRGLAPRLTGARFDRIEVRAPRLRFPVSVTQLRELVGSRVQSVDRRSKYLVMPTDGGLALVVHLGMSGRLMLHARSAPPIARHDHVSWWLTPRRARRALELRYHDPRRFGAVCVVSVSDLPAHPLFAKLGPEPLDGLDASQLAAQARGSRRAIKNVLMDASVVVGVGNIYASETLWLARVHPAVAAGRLSQLRWARIVAAMKRVLEGAIAAGGTTLSDYRDADGNLGYFSTELRVYGREGDACERCGRRIRRRVDSGRSTYYCPGCQH